MGHRFEDISFFRPATNLDIMNKEEGGEARIGIQGLRGFIAP